MAQGPELDRHHRRLNSIGYKSNKNPREAGDSSKAASTLKGNGILNVLAEMHAISKML